MKKAAVVGAAVWSVPVMQTALAPAASASPTNLPPGASCTASTQCQFNNCAGGICGGIGATCSAGAQCADYGCDLGTTKCATNLPKGQNSSCSQNSACTSGIYCGSNTCGGTGATCTTDAQCWQTGPGKGCNTGQHKCK